MLKELIIENLVLIEHVHIIFDKGLNILTGETGAGKSIIIDAISLLMGERADKDAIRFGCNKGRVEALFDITDNKEIKDVLASFKIDINDEEYLILSRELNISGKNICRINGIAVSLLMFKEISAHLINLHAQGSHYSLLEAENHCMFLDRFAGSKIEDIKLEIGRIYDKWKNINTELSKWSSDPQLRQREIDLLTYQITEIDAAHLQVNEDIKLEQRRVIFNNYERIIDGLTQVYNCLYNGEEEQLPLIDILGQAYKGLKSMANADSELLKISESIETFIYNIEEISSSIRAYIEGLEYDPEQVREIDDRLNVINSLKHKYGNTIEEILSYKEKLVEKLNFYENSQQYIENLEKERETLEDALYDACIDLSDKRRQAAFELESRIMNELKDIGLENAIFKVSILSPDNKTQARYTIDGFDTISFLMTANPGEPLRPLAKIASGGEMSRIMLALNAVLGHANHVPTMIFDEIDTGISGDTANKVAQKLVLLSLSHQIICVTHLAQIASMADMHYLITKQSKAHRTYTKVELLDENKRLMEIARLLGDTEASAVGIKYATEMINSGQAFKAGKY